MSKLLRFELALCLILFASPVLDSYSKSPRSFPRQEAARNVNQDSQGQSRTLLPDGNLLLLGGEGIKGPSSAAVIENPVNGQKTALPIGLRHARYGHSATLLPNGLVLIFGGIGTNGKVQTIAESFDPTTSKFQDLPQTGLTPRAYHSVTVLTDGRVLVAGGVSSSGDTLSLLELWDFATNTATKLDIALHVPRSKHTATLLANGTVMFWGGLDSSGSPLNFGEVFDGTANSTFISTSRLPANPEPPQVEASLPADRSTNVPPNSIISMRFSEPLNVLSLNSQTVTLSGPQGSESAKVVPAEGGRLVFLTPGSPLAEGTTFTISVNGAVNSASALIAPTLISFTTSRS